MVIMKMAGSAYFILDLAFYSFREWESKWRETERLGLPFSTAIALAKTEYVTTALGLGHLYMPE